MSRKDRIAPFEVMRTGKDQRERQAVTTPMPGNEHQDLIVPVADASPVVFEPTGSGPLVLRIPKGYAVVMAVVLLGLFGMSYWVGYSRGDKDRQAKDRAELQSRQEMYNRTSGIAPSSIPPLPSASQHVAKNDVVSIQGSGQTPADPHGHYVAGYNYFVLVHYPPKEANELVAFLTQHGVDTAAIFVNNNRFKVVALEGFLASELDSPRAKEYKQLLRRLGRLWQDSKRGAGDLSDMYPERYDGPDGKAG